MMTPEAFAGVLESIAHALRTMQPGGQPAFALPAMSPVPEPPPSPPAPTPATEPPPVPVTPETVAAECGGTMASWLTTYRTIIRQRGYDAQTIKNRTTSINYIDSMLGKRVLRQVKPHEIATLLKACKPHKANGWSWARRYPKLAAYAKQDERERD